MGQERATGLNVIHGTRVTSPLHLVQVWLAPNFQLCLGFTFALSHSHVISMASMDRGLLYADFATRAHLLALFAVVNSTEVSLRLSQLPCMSLSVLERE